MRNKSRVTRSVNGDGEARYWLVGKLFCGMCGHSMQGTFGTGKCGTRYNYYGCGNHLKARGCPKKTVDKERIENAVTAILSMLLDDYELLTSFAVDAADYYKKNYGDHSYRHTLEAELKENEKSLKNIVKANRSRRVLRCAHIEARAA